MIFYKSCPKRTINRLRLVLVALNPRASWFYKPARSSVLVEGGREGQILTKHVFLLSRNTSNGALQYHDHYSNCPPHAEGENTTKLRVTLAAACGSTLDVAFGNNVLASEDPCLDTTPRQEALRHLCARHILYPLVHTKFIHAHTKVILRRTVV